jgi:hypothetical protein
LDVVHPTVVWDGTMPCKCWRDGTFYFVVSNDVVMLRCMITLCQCTSSYLLG